MKHIIWIIIIVSCLSIMNCEEGGNSVIGSKDHDIKSATAKEPAILANGIATTRIVINVKNKKDNSNANGMIVHFKTTAGNIEEYGTTNTNGNAEVVLTSAASETDLIAEITATVVDTNFAPLNKNVPSPFKIAISTPDFESPQKKDKKLAKANEQQDNRATITVKFLGVFLQTEIEDAVIPADGVSESKVTIRLRETTSLKVIKDAEIRFLLTYGTILGSIKTDAQGNSEVYLKSAKKAVDDTLVIEYGNQITQRIPVRYVSPKFALNPKKARVPADGVSKVQMIATLLTQQNTPITGAKVKFSTTAGVIFESAFTDNYGQARVDLVAGTQPDSLVKVTAKFLSLSDSAMISFGSIDVKTITILGDTDPLLRNGRTSKQIGLIAKNTLGLPVADVVINLRTNIGNVPATIVTDQQGSAAFQFTTDSGTADATATITASVGTIQATQTVNLLGVSMVVTANPASILADGKSTSNIRVEVKQTTSHVAVSSQSINFAADRGTIATTASTDNQGVATTTYTAGNVAGIATINVTCGALMGDVKVALLTNYPKNITMTADSEPILRDGVASKQLSLQATNELGQPVANVAVNINANLGTVPGSVITDQQGFAAVKYTADAGNSDATATITASVGNVQATQTVRLLGITMSLTANPTSILADGIATSAIRVEVKQSVSHVAITNHPISFAADLGTISTTASTDNQGITTIAYTAGTTPGTATIKIACGLLKGELKITLLANYPKSILFSADANPVLRDGLATKQISLTTANELGSPIPNVTVNLQANRGIVPANITTDSQGKAVFNYTGDSGTSDATATITASAGIVQATQTVNLLGISMVVTANPASILADGKSTSNIRVEVKQTTSHLALSNHPITFATNLGFIPTTASTDNQGIATTTYTASSASGIATVYATCGTLMGDVKVALLTNYPKNISLTVDSAPILRDGIATKQLSLQATNELGGGVANVAINLNANLGTVPGSVITDQQGNATFQYTADAGNSDANATITASVGSVQATRTVKLLGISMTVSANPTSLLANGITTSLLRVEVKETVTKTAVTSHPINFTTDLGTIPTTASTDNQGIATITYTAGTSPGIATIKIACGLLKGEQKITLVANYPKTIELSADTNPIIRDGLAIKQISVSTLNELGGAVANVVVNLQVNRGTVPATIMTDSQGKATFNYTADAESSDATATITASAGTVQATKTVNLLGISMVLTANPASILADGKSTSTIRVEVKQTTSHLAVSNHAIAFATNSGTIPTTASTNNEGIATTTYTASNASGTATIYVTCGTLMGNVKVALLANFPKNISLNADSEPILRDGVASKQLSLQVTNDLGQPVANVAVNIAANLGTVPGSVITDQQGFATVKYTADAGNSDATATITASVGTIQATRTVKLLGITMTVTANPTSILANGSATSLIRVEVKETITKTAVPNHPINFAADLGNIATTASTNNEGIATITYTAGTTPGTATISIACGLLKGELKLTLVANYPKSIELSADTNPIIRDGLATKSISVSTLNELGGAVANVAVNLQVNRGAVPATIMTDSQGKATFNYTADAGTSDATATITASVGNVQATQTVNLLGISMTTSATPDSIAADDKATATIQVVIKQTTSNIAVAGHLINFATDNGQIPNTATTNNQGVATTTFTSSKQPGTATVTASCGTLTQTVKVYLFDNFANSILLTSEHNFIWVKGTGHIQQTIITAKVLGVTGEPVTTEYRLKFRIVNGPGGGEKIEPSTGSGLETTVISTVNGKAEAKFLSGTISGAAQIRAELVDYPQVNAQTTNIIIRSGPPYIWIDPVNINNVITHMTLAVEPGKHNLAFGNPIQEIKITAYLGDRYNNPVEDETVVYLTTTGGYITTNAVTCEKGQASVILQNVNPFPYLVSNDPSQLTAFNIPNPNNEIFNDSLKLPIILPDFEGGEVLNSIGTTKENDGMAVIVAYTWGQDQSGNAVKVWATARVIYSVGVARFTAVTNKTELAVGESATISIRVYDTYGNPVAAGSSLSVSTTAGELSDTNLMPGADRYGFGTTFFSVQLLNNLKTDDDATTAMVKIILDSPNGTGKISIPIALKITP